jgi:hypothetical protein
MDLCQYVSVLRNEDVYQLLRYIDIWRINNSLGPNVYVDRLSFNSITMATHTFTRF